MKVGIVLAGRVLWKRKKKNTQAYTDETPIFSVQNHRQGKDIFFSLLKSRFKRQLWFVLSVLFLGFFFLVLYEIFPIYSFIFAVT